MGSVIMTGLPSSPARFHETRNLTREGELPEAQTAKAELPQVAAGPSAAVASVVLAHLELGFAQRLGNGGLFSQLKSPISESSYTF